MIFNVDHYYVLVYLRIYQGSCEATFVKMIFHIQFLLKEGETIFSFFCLLIFSRGKGRRRKITPVLQRTNGPPAQWRRSRDIRCGGEGLLKVKKGACDG